MKVYGIRCKEVMACAGSWAVVAEAAVEEDGKEVYVMIQEYDGTEYVVTDKSLYDFLAGDGDEPNAEFLEEHTTWKEAQGSAYAGVFKMLKGVMKKLGAC